VQVDSIKHVLNAAIDGFSVFKLRGLHQFPSAATGARAKSWSLLSTLTLTNVFFSLQRDTSRFVPGSTHAIFEHSSNVLETKLKRNDCGTLNTGLAATCPICRDPLPVNLARWGPPLVGSQPDSGICEAPPLP
jgi:hypothetical protein